MKTNTFKLAITVFIWLFASSVCSFAQNFKKGDWFDDTVFNWVKGASEVEIQIKFKIIEKRLHELEDSLITDVLNSADTLRKRIQVASDYTVNPKVKRIVRSSDESVNLIVREAHMSMKKNGKSDKYRQEHASSMKKAAQDFMNKRDEKAELVVEYNQLNAEEAELKSLCAKNGFKCE